MLGYIVKEVFKLIFYPNTQYLIFMRFLVRAVIPTEAGNKMVNDPKFIQEIEEYMKKMRVEAAYFTELGGDRTMVFVLDIPNVDKIPSVAEPLFQKIHAKVELHPAMTFEDLKNAFRESKGKS